MTMTNFRPHTAATKNSAAHQATNPACTAMEQGVVIDVKLYGKYAKVDGPFRC